MKIKHYRAPDMRTALRQVKDAQGPDAVILSSRRVQGGVEVVAAIDYDAEVADGPSMSAAGYGLATSPEPEPREFLTQGARGMRTQGRTADTVAHKAAPRASEPHESIGVDDDTTMNEELRTLRRMLETQLATLAWN